MDARTRLALPTMPDIAARICRPLPPVARGAAESVCHFLQWQAEGLPPRATGGGVESPSRHHPEASKNPLYRRDHLVHLLALVLLEAEQNAGSPAARFWRKNGNPSQTRAPRK